MSQNSATTSPDPAGRASMSSTRASLEQTTSNTSTSSQDRRRSSSGLFSNLEAYKRGRDDYAARRASHADQMPPSGVLGGWFNATFRGMNASPEKK